MSRSAPAHASQAEPAKGTHLLFDGPLSPWGNGVHLFAPLSWALWNAGWFGFDSWPVWVFTAVGATVAPIALWQARHGGGVLRVSRARLGWAAALLVLYLASPIPLRHGPFAVDAHSVATLRGNVSRAGGLIELDRTSYRVRGHGHFIETYGGAVIHVANEPLDSDAVISVRATFVNDTTVRIDAHRDHSRSPRDLLNYPGMALVAFTWLGGLRGHPPGERLGAGSDRARDPGANRGFPA